MSTNPPVKTETKPLLNDATYNTLKWVALVGLPALATVYAGLAVLWGWPNVGEVTGSIGLVDTGLGSLLGISTATYNNSAAKYDGSFVVDPNPSTPLDPTHSLEFNTPLETMEKQKQIILKVVLKQPPVTPTPPVVAPPAPVPPVSQ